MGQTRCSPFPVGVPQYRHLIPASIPCHLEPDVRFPLIRLSDNLLALLKPGLTELGRCRILAGGSHGILWYGVGTAADHGPRLLARNLTTPIRTGVRQWVFDPVSVPAPASASPGKGWPDATGDESIPIVPAEMPIRGNPSPAHQVVYLNTIGHRKPEGDTRCSATTSYHC